MRFVANVAREAKFFSKQRHLIALFCIAFFVICVRCLVWH